MMIFEQQERVRFTFTGPPFTKDGAVKAAIRAFGLSQAQAEYIFEKEGTIICRPAQFARFIIYRCEYVKINTFQTLKANLFIVPPEVVEIDVSDVGYEV